MDSFTQITLGAAVGEVVLGKKAGNRAMLWGAIGGTMPDLDVMANLATDEMSALAFHRAITHSLTFAILSPVALGWLVHRIYQRKENRPATNIWRDFALVAPGVFILIAIGVFFMPIPVSEILPISFTVGGGILFFPVLVLIRESFRRRPPRHLNPDWKAWSWLFFWAIFTHPLLDSCTTYGTQLFQPFWDYRVGLNNISVVDPAYTLPFLTCVIITAILTRNSKARRIVNCVGIVVSTCYLLFTFYNKYQVDQVFEQSLEAQKVSYHRFMTSPTILNNVLWQGVAEGDTAYYFGVYSIFDKQPAIKEFISIPKNHHLIAAYEGERPVEILKWFSNGYYRVAELPDGSLQLSDLRFGSLSQSPDNPSDFVFRFIIKKENGQLEVFQSRERPENAGEALGRLFERMEGI